MSNQNHTQVVAINLSIYTIYIDVGGPNKSLRDNKDEENISY